MGARVDDQDLDSLTPFQRNGYLKVETDRGTYFLARNEYDAFEAAIKKGDELFIGEDPRGNSCGVRLRYGDVLVIDGYTDWTPAALAAYIAEVEAAKLRGDD